ncbi:lipase family protein [Rhodococcus sp. ARC_M6]|uniref:lipase family protein n=1 Tax=Rhodococcus sp. ARC_M6 TaxID=2928852 RepID=UPI001FB27A99|nr:lipase family protein [Rhodococcus sp. ARC_M6]MCJ0906847.1 lipase family protein [Rhodococcus sp. ARC_M6]
MKVVQKKRVVRLSSGTLALCAAVSAAAFTSTASAEGSLSFGSVQAAPQLSPGTLITAHNLIESAALPSAAKNERITYLSQSASGKNILVSGVVAIPKTPAPAGGWPVVSWAHGTTGVADACAPSADTPKGPVHDYLSGVDQTLDKWVANGYVVVQTDFEGLGTPGGHPYMNGTSAANTVTDIVRAARQVDPSVGKDWFAMGHSQGGQAAVFTAALGQDRAPELNLKGAVSVAPGNGTAKIPELVSSGNAAMSGAVPFVPVILLGAQAADPSIIAEELLSDEAQPLLEAARTGCLAAVRAVPPIPVNQIFRAGADLTALTANLNKQELATVTPKVPTLFAQGTADVLVSVGSTTGAVKDFCSKGSEVEFMTYEGADHRGAIGASYDDALDFTTRMLAGQAVNSGTC